MVVLNSLNRKFVRYLLPTFVWAVLIFLVSSVPGNKIPALFSYQDILFHILEYGIFGWLIIRAFKKYYPNLNYLNYIYLTVAISIIYAIGDEIHQRFVPYRDANVLDASLDTAGALIGSLFFSKFHPKA